jgi:glycerate kinase
MRVVIAPDSFKGTINNFVCAKAIAKGWFLVRPTDEVIQLPMADGGEGTLETIKAARPTSIRTPINGVEGADWLLLDDGTAIVELASICGVTMYPELEPLAAHTYKFGLALKQAALDPRVREIVATVGGSASTDGGVGALIALGAHIRNIKGEPISLGGGGLQEIASIDLSQVIRPPVNGVTCLVDVKNPLLGATGSAQVFSPQKGATPDQVKYLEAGLARLKDISGAAEFEGAGAAGGTPFGLSLGWKLKVESGAQRIAKLIGLTEALAEADLVITGEGRLDSQSSFGKVVGTVRQIAQDQKTPVWFCVGSSEDSLGAYGISLMELAPSLRESMENPEEWLVKAGAFLARRVED